MNNLNYQVDLYRNQQYEYLERHKEMIWVPLSISRILWEWVNGIVLKTDDPNMALKIRKPWMEKDDIGREVQNHKKVYEAVLEWKKVWVLPEHIHVPELWEIDPSPYLKAFFYMQRIHGQTISSEIFRLEHAWLKQESADYLDTLTDREIIELMIQKYGSRTDELVALRKKFTREYFEDVYKSSTWKLGIVLKYLWEQCIYHTDLHSGNVMKDHNANIWPIDFWTMHMTHATNS